MEVAESAIVKSGAREGAGWASPLLPLPPQAAMKTVMEIRKS